MPRRPLVALATVARDVELATVVSEQAKLERTVGPLPSGPIEPPKPKRTNSDDGCGDCAHCSTDEPRNLGLLGLGVLALLGFVRRRRHR